MLGPSTIGLMSPSVMELLKIGRGRARNVELGLHLFNLWYAVTVMTM